MSNKRTIHDRVVKILEKNPSTYLEVGQAIWGKGFEEKQKEYLEIILEIDKNYLFKKYGYKEDEIKEVKKVPEKKKATNFFSVFLSYSTLDSDRFQIKNIAKILKSYSEIKDAFFWEADSGGNIVEYMEKTLKKCNVFVLFCSKNALNSKAVTDEWQAAFQLRKKGSLKIIPVYEDEKYVPALLTPLLNVKFSKDNFIDFIVNLYHEVLREYYLGQVRVNEETLDEIESSMNSALKTITKRSDKLNSGKDGEKKANIEFKLSPENERLFKMLKSFKLRLSKEEDVQAFVINKKEVRNMNLFEYRRVSTETQKRNITIEIQEILNREYKERNGFNVEKVFIDDGKSGHKHDEFNRTAYNQMWRELIERPDIDGIFAYDLARLSKDSEELMRLRKLLKNNNKILVLTSYGNIIKNRLQIARKIKYETHPEIFGRPKKEIPEKLKKRMIHWYQVQQDGFFKISRLILTEDIKGYSDWFQRLYPNGFGKREGQFYLSPQTVGERLKEWKVKIRNPKFRKSTTNTEKRL
jgi:hypothetical protein